LFFCHDRFVPELSARLRPRVRAEFGTGRTSDAIVFSVASLSDAENVQAAVILSAGGRPSGLLDAFRLCKDEHFARNAPQSVEVPGIATADASEYVPLCSIRPY
jgi:hypothetical protein